MSELSSIAGLAGSGAGLGVEAGLLSNPVGGAIAGASSLLGSIFNLTGSGGGSLHGVEIPNVNTWIQQNYVILKIQLIQNPNGFFVNLPAKPKQGYIWIMPDLAEGDIVRVKYQDRTTFYGIRNGWAVDWEFMGVPVPKDLDFIAKEFEKRSHWKPPMFSGNVNFPEDGTLVSGGKWWTHNDPLNDWFFTCYLERDGGAVSSQSTPIIDTAPKRVKPPVLSAKNNGLLVLGAVALAFTTKGRA